ncbi:MAG: TldD/PmbA family protein [Bacteroidales bacterium]|nr:TldD/PmbA family protein [Bacteroidales bacterium]
MIETHEIEIARHCIAFACANGADNARVNLNKSGIDGCNMLNGELDKVTHAADRSVYLYLFVNGKYGTFSTNMLEKESLEDFILKAIDMVKMLGEDTCRKLPDPSRTEKNANTGRELDLYDEAIEHTDSDSRLAKAKAMSIWQNSHKENNGEYSLISEECEYSESYDDSITIDSQGFEGRHTESSFSFFTEVTIQDKEGNRYSGYWWDTLFRNSDADPSECSRKALERAVAQIAPQPRRSGHTRMVVDSTVASRLVAPVLNALNGSALQQKMSFLDGTLGQKVFSESMNLMDLPRTAGRNGSRMYDSEGVATKDAPVIKDGVVCQYFINTYNAEKMGIEPTVEDASRPCLMPYMKGKELATEEISVSLKDILQYCRNGILVTGFNGGNTNPVTGDFSFGIEGFAFSKGKITHPVREMLITGNLKDLWNSLIAAGTDARPSSRWQIPSIAFENVSFSA